MILEGAIVAGIVIAAVKLYGRHKQKRYAETYNKWREQARDQLLGVRCRAIVHGNHPYNDALRLYLESQFQHRGATVVREPDTAHVSLSAELLSRPSHEITAASGILTVVYLATLEMPFTIRAGETVLASSVAVIIDGNACPEIGKFRPIWFTRSPADMQLAILILAEQAGCSIDHQKIQCLGPIPE